MRISDIEFMRATMLDAGAIARDRFGRAVEIADSLGGARPPAPILMGRAETAAALAQLISI
jgi:hypothetical protein